MVDEVFGELRVRHWAPVSREPGAPCVCPKQKADHARRDLRGGHL